MDLIFLVYYGVHQPSAVAQDLHCVDCYWQFMYIYNFNSNFTAASYALCYE